MHAHRYCSAAAFALLAACGGGGGGGNNGTPPVTNPVPQPAATPTPTTVTAIAIAFATGDGAPVAGVAQSFPLQVTVKDQNGNVIQGPYPEPITLTDSDASGITRLSTTAVTSGTQAVSLQYTGQRLSNTVTISASATGVAGGNITSATFTPDATHTYWNGDKFTYTESRTTTSVATQPTPAPSATTATYTVTLSVESSPGVSFNGHDGLIDISESDIATNANITQNIQNYYAYVPGSLVKFVDYGYVENDRTIGANSSTEIGTTLKYETPALVDELPQSADAIWNPAAPYIADDTQHTQSGTSTYDDADEVIEAADGSYKYAYNGLWSSATFNSADYWQYDVNSDASFAVTENYADNSGIIYNAAYSAPQPSSNLIPVTYSCASGLLNLPPPATTVSPGPFPTPQPGSGTSASCYNPQTGQTQATVNVVVSIPNWYPPNSLPLDREQKSVAGIDVPIPAQCNLPSSFGLKANDEHYTDDYLDPTGLVYSESADSYFVNNYGLVCDIVTSDAKSYDVVGLVSGSLLGETKEEIVRSLRSFTPGVQANQRRPQSLAAINALFVPAFTAGIRNQMLRDARRMHEIHHNRHAR